MSDKTLQFGVNLNNREPLIAPDYDLQALLDLSSVVEESGFDSVWVGDSLFSKPRYEPLALLSAISQRTSRVRLGTACLVTSTRNPLYLGSFLIGLGFTIAAGQPFLVFVFIVMILGIYLPVMRVEAETLAELFGRKYTRYASEVPLFWPRFSPYRDYDNEFDRSLYLRYREYRAAVGAVVAWALLAVKAIYFK